MRSIGKGIFSEEKRVELKGKKKKRTGKDTACLEFHSRPGRRIQREKKKMREGKRGRRVSTIFQTYLRSVKYTVKKYTILDI